MAVRITEGSIVYWTLRAGLWRVVRLVPARETHGVIPIFDAVIEPVGEGWGRMHRQARLTEISIAPPDIEDFPCGPA